jgi:hypothetical protein
MKTVAMTFIPNDSTKPERMLAEAEMHFAAPGSPIHGFKLAGFSIWRAPDGDLYVTLPARAFGAGTDRRYFDFLRADAEGAEYGARTRRLKAWILDEYKLWLDGREA